MCIVEGVWCREDDTHTHKIDFKTTTLKTFITKMNNAVINFPLPANEPVKAYMPGSPERVALVAEL